MHPYRLFIQYTPNPLSARPTHVNPVQIAALDDAEAERQAEAVAAFLMSGVASQLVIRVVDTDPGQPVATINRP